MQKVDDTLRLLGGMPSEALIAIVILAAFGLAAFAIYAVLTATKVRRK